MTSVVRVAFQDGEGAVNLLQENDAGEFVGDGHLPQRKDASGRFAGLAGKTIRRTDSQNKRVRIAILMILEELGKFFGGERLAAGIKENQSVSRPSAALFTQSEEGGFFGKGHGLDVRITRDPLEVLRSERLNGWISGLADPGDFQFHRGDLSIWACRLRRGMQ